MENYKEYIVKVYEGQTKWYNKDGQLHREDGPAVECADGTKEWYKNGKHHREDGPAIEHASGGKSWYKVGKLHREDGPAEMYPNGDCAYYLYGKEFTEEEFKSLTQKMVFNSNAIIEINGKKYKLVQV